MLTLQRASAGSGKTYTLTKKYIGLLISIREPGQDHRRLRTKAELADSVKHILAVTFTNKATNEMKERIVGKLYELAYLCTDGKKTDYLDDFVAEYSATTREVSEACREALRQLLYEYGDFNISTIDAFFQNILRTFAYESDLPDSYQVMIDESYLARHAAMELVDDIAQGRADADERYWVRLLIEDANKSGENNWNLFQRREGSGIAAGVFGRLSRMAASLEKYELGDVKGAMDRFSQSGQNLRESREKINAMLADRGADLFAPLVVASRRVMDEYSAVGDAELLLPRGASTVKFIGKVLDPKADPLGDFRLAIGAGHLQSKLPAAKKRELEFLRQVWEEFASAYKAWDDFRNGDDLKYWRMSEGALPGVALMSTLRDRINNYLSDNGAMKLADTNLMIRRIIADDDVPFIYERLGTRLNHFLIDEFQDTSLLQWENFRPLLEESEGHGHDNLIIGDAKQSIYRFRSAEPTLITDVVPATFPRLEARGFSVADNSNWRSLINVVKFNNLFFRALSDRLGDKMASLYSNTVQLPRSKDEEEKGYVEVNFYDIPAAASEDVDGATDNAADEEMLPPTLVERIGLQISEMLRRGYRQKEIAILVNTRKAGKQTIAGLMEYNRRLPQGEPPIEFVSEDSLTLDTSGAVNTIIECFRLIQKSVEKGGGEAAGTERRERVQWNDIRNSFRFFSARNQDKDLVTQLHLFFEQQPDNDIIDSMLAGMQAITLPSLVEALAEIFTNADQRRLEAPFIAALQDAVLDYCEISPTDIGSMLRWWEAEGHRICISSPEDTDAVNVMTIHKSKGLEFECVILPDIDLNLDMGSETLWVNMPRHLSYSGLLPEMLPVKMSLKSSEGTVWQEQFADERYKAQVDQLNKAYVALTRAVSELYIYLPTPFRKGELDTRKSTKSHMRYNAYEICRDADALTGDLLAEEKERGGGEVPLDRMLPSAGEIAERKEGELSFVYGRQLACPAESLREKRGKKNKEGVDSRQIERYFINSDRSQLHFHPEGTPYIFDEADDDRADPRSEGSLKHAALELVEREEDLPGALARLRGRGIITRKVMRQYEEELSQALADVRDRGWFDGTRRVINERPMLRRGEIMKRPDRVMVDADGNATVVDYKFGDKTKISEHRRQVREYMEWLAGMGRYGSVSGYIWYVKHGDIVEVKPR